MFFSRCPYRGHEAKVARIFLGPIGVPDSEGVNSRFFRTFQDENLNKKYHGCNRFRLKTISLYYIIDIFILGFSRLEIF